MEERTAEFQSFRMRTFNVKGNGSCLWKGKSFMALKRLNGIVQRSALKLSHPPVCSVFRILCPFTQLRYSLQRGAEVFVVIFQIKLMGGRDE